MEGPGSLGYFPVYAYVGEMHNPSELKSAGALEWLVLANF